MMNLLRPLFLWFPVGNQGNKGNWFNYGGKVGSCPLLFPPNLAGFRKAAGYPKTERFSSRLRTMPH
jgi:hypothetical protein